MTEKDIEKDRIVEAVVGAIEKNFGKGSLMSLSSNGNDVVEVIETGSLRLDDALGVGGYPRGRIIEIYGPESSGKTTLTLHAIAQMQKLGGVCAFIDAEHAFDKKYAQNIGVKLPHLLVSQPDCGEQALDITEALTRTGTIDLVVIDSVAALVPKAEVEGEMSDQHVGLHARLMSRALRKLTSVAHKTNTTIIFINQLRTKIGVTFGSPETTTGGKALKFYASIRLDVRRIGKLNAGEKVVGNRTRVKVVKNKVAQPFTEAEVDLRWGIGIDPVTDVLDLAVEHDVLQKNGAHYSMNGKSFAQGREKARDALLADPTLRAKVTDAVSSKLPSKQHRNPAPAESDKPQDPTEKQKPSNPQAPKKATAPGAKKNGPTSKAA